MWTMAIGRARRRTRRWIDHFNNVEEATNELLAYNDAVISAITWIELACKFNDTDKQAFAAMLAAAGIRVVPPRA